VEQLTKTPQNPHIIILGKVVMEIVKMKTQGKGRQRAAGEG
jgi:hypothetical protein